MIEGILGSILGGGGGPQGILSNILGGGGSQGLLGNILNGGTGQQAIQNPMGNVQNALQDTTNKSEGLAGMIGIEGGEAGTGGQIGQTVGSALGTLIPIPGVGSMLGGMGGNLLGSWVGSMINKEKEPEKFGGGAKTAEQIKYLMGG